MKNLYVLIFLVFGFHKISLAADELVRSGDIVLAIPVDVEGGFEPVIAVVTKKRSLVCDDALSIEEPAKKRCKKSETIIDDKFENDVDDQAMFEPAWEDIFKTAQAYEKGRGDIKIDLKKARQLYRKAAHKGHLSSRIMLALMQELGRGGAQKLDAAFINFNNAARRKSCEAKYHLGRCYLYGIGVDVDLAKAEENLIAAIYEDEGVRFEDVEKKANNALVHLGRKYLIANKPGKAFLCFETAAENDDIDGLKEAAICLHNSVGVSANKKKAEQYLKRIDELMKLARERMMTDDIDIEL